MKQGELNIKTVKIRIVGTAPLIVSAWNAEWRTMVHYDPPRKLSSYEQLINSLYWLDGKPGV